MQVLYSKFQNQCGANLLVSLENAKYDIKCIKSTDDELKVIVEVAQNYIEEQLNNPKYLEFIKSTIMDLSQIEKADLLIKIAFH